MNNNSRATRSYVNPLMAALLGGYFFTWGFTAFGIAGLAYLGVDFHEAETGVLIVAFPLYLLVFLRAFSDSRTPWVWLVLLGSGGVMATAARGLQSLMLNGALT